ncbi:hypothetical protein H4219_005794 [Mycoemilia scoparia]|uniref:Uncharacterized protein n=1 Tax=Mycoemilia scoparia TaxID=417184 RepID=A0A9W7ZS51_9FUNG|nr:hypothetical protein H4219_005794 [Mycoemilia scoparia]
MASTAPPREDEVVMGGTDQGPERAPPVSAPAPAAATTEPTKQIEFSFVSNGFERPTDDMPAAAVNSSTRSVSNTVPLTAAVLPTKTTSSSPDPQAGSDKTSEGPWVQVKSLSQKHREGRQHAACRTTAHAVAKDLKASLFTGGAKMNKKKSRGKFSFPPLKNSSFSSTPLPPAASKPAKQPSSPPGKFSYKDTAMTRTDRHNKSLPLDARIEGARRRMPAL